MADPDKKKFKGKLNYDALRRSNARRFKKINDIYIESAFTVAALKKAIKLVEKSKSATVIIPTPSVKNKPIEIRRKKADITAMLALRVQSREYIQSIVFAIAVTEDYISESLVNLLRAYPQKLLISLKGNEKKATDSQSVELRDLVEAGSFANIVNEIAKKRAHDCLYATPAAYMNYMKSVLRIEIDDKLIKQFAEVKATRDVYVHGDGAANAIYKSKAGDASRAELGEILPVDEDYLKQGVSCMKKIFSSIYVGLVTKFGDSDKSATVLASVMKDEALRSD